MKQIKIITTQGEFDFSGKYRRDLETKNWHYYEMENGDIIHIRKEHFVAVLERNI